MLSLPTSVRIFLSAEPTDMRKGFDSLAAVVRRRGLDVFNGHLYVFVSRGRDRVKILTWERGGFALWYKRLEKGRLHLPAFSPEQKTVPLDAGQLAMLLEGVDFSKVRRSAVWEPSENRNKGIDKIAPP